MTRPAPPAAHEPSSLNSLLRTRDELVLVLERLRLLVGDRVPVPLDVPPQSQATDPYPVILANLRTALAHIQGEE